MTTPGWSRTRLKYVAKANSSTLPDDTDDDFEFTYVDISNVSQGTINTASHPIKFKDAPSRARRLAAPGDSVVSTVRTYLRAVATVPEIEGPLVFSTGFAVLHPREGVFPRYLSWYLQGDEFVSRIEANSTGVSYPAISANQLVALDLNLPPLDQQQQIADYLDRETAQIDTLIAEQQRLVEMLRGRRRAVVRTAVPEPGSAAIPTDKLGRRTKIGNGSTPRREETKFWEGGHIPWLNSAVVNQDRVTAAGQFVTDEAVAKCHLPMVPAGSLLVALTGQGKTRGTATILDIEATINQHMAYVTPEPGFWDAEYLMWCLTAAYNDLRAVSDENGSTKGALTCEDLKRFRVAHPPLDEQRRIAMYLAEQTSKIDALVAEAERFIELARERRAALITAAVTGQIDVRESVA